MKQFLILVLISFSISYAFSQGSQGPSATENMGIIGKSTENGVLLRWAPAKFSIWQWASHSGWIIERTQIEDYNFETDIRTLRFEQIARVKAMSKQEWEQNLDINDKRVVIAAQALFGDKNMEKPNVEGFGGVLQSSEVQSNRHAMAMYAADLSEGASIGLGLRYTDKTAVAGNAYIYRLRLDKNKEGFGADTVYLVIEHRGVNFGVPVPQGLQMEPEHGKFRIQWPKGINAEVFTAFNLERSSDGKTFQRINELPLSSSFSVDQSDWQVYVDSTVQIGNRYFYQLRGITAFAEESDPSIVIEDVARDMEAPMPPLHVSIDQDKESYKITWSLPDSLITPDCIGWIVKRSARATGIFDPIHDNVLPLKQRVYTDKNPMPIFNNYYVVYAVDTAGNENPSMVYVGIWRDSTPPTPPVNLRAEVDTTGNFILKWDQNPEIDLMGYRVFIKSDAQKEWYQLTDRPIAENFYIDSVDVRTLSKSLYLTVVATDLNYNVSHYAKAIKLELPDLVAPSAPRWSAWSVKDQQLNLQWHPSAASDVATHRLLKRKDGGEWTKLQDFSGKVFGFQDKLDNNVVHDYALLAIDSTGNVSDTILLTDIVSTYAEKIKGVESLNVKHLERESAFEVSWSFKQKDKVQFLLYRKDSDSDDIELVGSFSQDINKHVDKGPTEFGNGFSYYLRVIDSQGRISDVSEPVAVRFKSK
jgi:hypothetical protein